MATTVSQIETQLQRHIRDTSNVSASAADRLDAITEAVRSLYTEFEFDFTNRTFDVNYLDGVYYYDITTDVPDFLEPVDLRREIGDHTEAVTRKSPRELAVEIDSGNGEFSVATERRNEKNYLGIIHTSKYPAKTLHTCNDVDTNGTWTADTTNGDATNITQDTVELKEGSGAINFDIDVSQSGNDKAEIYNEDMAAVDLSEHEDLSSIVWWAYIPDTTNFTSITAYWGSSSSAYWSAAATTDLYGASFADGWNRVKVDWSAATPTGSPDASAIDYLQFDFNYAGGQGDDTDFRLDNVQSIRPEKLTFHYNSWAIGRDNSGNLIYDFTATTDVPFYSGIYDYFDDYVALKAASIVLDDLGLYQDAANKEQRAQRKLLALERKMPSSRLTTTRNFKANINW